MHPYAIDRMVAERRQELLRLRGAGGPARTSREERRPARRRSFGRALVAVAVALGAPRVWRRAGRRVATAPIGIEAALGLKRSR